MNLSFDKDRTFLEKEFTEISWIEDSGLDASLISKAVEDIEKQYSSKAIIKAKTFEYIANNA